MHWPDASWRPRIAHLIESDGPGGAERVVVELATALQGAGVENIVFLPADGEGWLANELRGSGVAVAHFRIDRGISASCMKSLARRFKDLQIDVAHSHEFTLAVYGAWAASLAGVPHVITMHGSRYYAQRLRRWLAMRTAVEMSGRTIAVSSALGHAISRDLRIPRSRIRVIPNGVRYVSPARVTLRDELQLGPRDRLLIAVGNLYPVKGHAHLVDAVALLAARHPTLRLAIAGRGALADALAARAREHGIHARVHLLGLRSDVPAMLAAADVFVLPSLSEGLPLALVEAMFAGRPIVASDVGEVARVLAHGEAGLLVPPGDAGAMAEAIDTLLTDPDRARTLADRARLRARAEYDVSRMVGRYLRIYLGLLRLRHPAGVPRIARLTLCDHAVAVRDASII